MARVVTATGESALELGLIFGRVERVLSLDAAPRVRWCPLLRLRWCLAE